MIAARPWALLFLVAGCTTEFPGRTATSPADAAEDATAPRNDAAPTEPTPAGGAQPPGDALTDRGQIADASGPGGADAARDAGPPPPDTDGDGVADPDDNCPRHPNPDQADNDFDGVGDVCDPCPNGGEPVDADADGVYRCNGDCDDTSRDTFPDAVERCDGRDNDCDGQTDEDFPDLGTPCTTGVGVCAVQGRRICSPDLATTRCDALPGAPELELCNGLDDDCDGTADEGVPDCCVEGEQRDCGLGVGACLRGLQRCGADRSWGECDAPGPEEEVCDGLDNDCDGTVDEGVLNACLACGPPPVELCDGLDNDCNQIVDDGFDLEAPCEVGQGSCRRFGIRICAPDGTATCSAVPGQPRPEACNGLDDDCDGEVDEGLGSLGPCTVGVGACATTGDLRCAPGGAEACDAVPGTPRAEACNDLDDDCDGQVDEDFHVGDLCFEGVGNCATAGQLVCAGPDSVACNAQPQEPQAEVCDGTDQDCDGEVDEGAVCGRYMATHCRVWLAWADLQDAPTDSDTWAGCPLANEDEEGNERCTSTQPPSGEPAGIFWDVHLTGIVDWNDALGVAFTCDDPASPGLANWMETHCAVYLGWADTLNGQDDSVVWGPCPAQPAGVQENPARRCVSSGRDGRFHTMLIGGGGVAAGADDQLGVAFLCRDDTDPGRAAGAQASIDVWLGFDGNGSPIRVGSPTWGDTCPGVDRDNDGQERCVGSRGDGRFHLINLTGDTSANWSLGIGLTAN